jgi:hypothetical protein
VAAANLLDFWDAGRELVDLLNRRRVSSVKKILGWRSILVLLQSWFAVSVM